MAIVFKPNHRRVIDALTDIIQTEYAGTPILFEEPERFRNRSPQFFSIIPGNATLLQNYAGGSLREYQVLIRYYLRKPRLRNYRTNIFDYMSDRGERLTRLINNNTKYEDENNTFSELDLSFGTLADVFSSIVTYRWHNGRVESIDYDPVRTDAEDKRDLQIFEANFICNVMELT
ncbi:MAG: hypothetical protein Tp1111SUR768151_9 [Prokaryotic dsDNA virus sp.]|nr:MAG: hypothetical protein Tp1111SUR768151_9 [Prokaryotic dsDNA virus sp.]|tara:strand:+ start:3216 stop:3740 length:525 start_codon:yes stop_codon:yes gene_type:complete